ncbi:uncharacterized protein METZ01_LOCUS486519, partial [marine metagenome]
LLHHHLTLTFSFSPSIVYNASTPPTGLILLYKVMLGRHLWKRPFQPNICFDSG